MHIDNNNTAIAAGSRSRKTNTENNGCTSAHLLSHVQTCHKAFGFLAEACVGRKVEEPPSTAGVQTRQDNKNKWRKVEETTAPLKRLMLLRGVRGKKSTLLNSHKYN